MFSGFLKIAKNSSLKRDKYALFYIYTEIGKAVHNKEGVVNSNELTLTM